MGKLFTPLTPSHYTPPSDTQPTALPRLIDIIRQNQKLVNSAHEEDGNKIRDGILQRAGPEMIDIAKKYWLPRDANGQITEKVLQQGLAEMINNCVYFAAGAQKPDKQIKFDFFYMHCVNLSVFYRAIVGNGKEQHWLSTEERARLLELKARTDLALYVSRGSPELRMDDIKNYVPKSGKLDTWEGIMKRANSLPDDDGHSSKLVRALFGGEQVCRPLEGELGIERLPVRGDMWLKAGNMAIDSVEMSGGSKWIRNAGWDSAWADVPARESGGDSRL